MSCAVLPKCSWVASFHSAVGFVALTALDCQVSQLSPPAVSVFSDVLYRWGLSMCAICSLPLSSLEESSEVGQDMCFNQSVFPRDFRFLPFQSLSRGGGGESLWGCLVLPSVNSGPCCETEPFKLPLERLSLVWGFFPPLSLKGRVHIVNSTDSLKVKECRYSDSIFHFLSVQSNMVKVSFLFLNVTVDGDVSHLLSCLYSFFLLIAMTNSFAKPLWWLADSSHERKVAFLTKP